ncbi:winged helix-turn-helix domain-containing protein [Streptomyces sp. NPDC005438]|uniref:winged helix-turn-helix domain-containing protein n=1 Tax=Streptomyces sp. NPDC005438 TaxID=3156880 RepID=UPI0033B619CA
MTVPLSEPPALAARSPRLRVVRERAAQAAPAGGLSGYLILVPEGVDPRSLLDPGGVPVEIRPVGLGGRPTSPDTGATGNEADTAPDTGPEEPAGGGGDPVRVDSGRHLAEVDGRPLDLTYLEFQLLEHLVRHPHRVHSREQLVSTVWGYGHIGDGRTVDVHVARLRRKLGPSFRDRIVTVRRVGYKYVP